MILRNVRSCVLACCVLALAQGNAALADDDNTTVSGEDAVVLETDQADLSVESELADEVADEKAWPSAKVGNDLPYAGIFYGNAMAGRGSANSRIADEQSRRFRAERTGEIVSYTYNNRLLRDSEIESRCNTSGASSRWCKCEAANLDQNICGYTLSNPYHVGNGGTIVVELRPDDGTGIPSETEVLAKTEPFVPAENRDKWFATLNFTTPASIESGKIYHFVHTNLTPPTRCSLANVSASRASSCSRNEGAQGLNGNYISSTPSTTGRMGPFQGDLGAASLIRRRASSDWEMIAHTVSFYEAGYSDGVSVGDSYFSYDALRTKQTIGGSVLARQVFTVQDASRDVNGVWLNHGHRLGANGSSLQVKLKDSFGNVLATGAISPSEYCMELVQPDAPSPGRDCRDWGYTDLNEAVTLLEGHKYTLELSGASGAGFVLSTYQTLRGFGLIDRNQWQEARAELSTNGGSRWGFWTSKGGSERDLALLFTVVDMPKQLK